MEYNVDSGDLPLIGKYKWHIVGRGGKYYLVAYKKLGKRNYKYVYMHRIIMGLDFGDGLQVDHINGDGLDNRRLNLRLATQQQNQMNRRINRVNKNKFKGIVFHRKSGTWNARIFHNQKRYSLGYHPTQETAALAYNQKAKELFGEFACLNKVSK